MNDNTQKKAEPKAAQTPPPPEAGATMQAQATPPGKDSGLRALAAVARHWRLDWSLTRLSHVYGKDREPDGRELVRIAESEGLKASLHRVSWKRLATLQKQTPFLARLKSGAYFVVLKV